MTSVNFRDSSHALYIRIHIALLSIQSHWAYFPKRHLNMYVNSLTRQALINRVSKSDTEKILRIIPGSVANISALRIHVIIIFSDSCSFLANCIQLTGKKGDIACMIV